MRRLLAAVLVAGVAVAATAAPAWGHALLSSSDPADGTSLERAPSNVTVELTEEPDPALSEIRVVDASGNEYQQGSAQPVPGDPRTLRVSVGDLDEGVYTVSWRVLSVVDGHVTGGAFAFGVGVSPDEIEPADVETEGTPAPSPFEVAGRWGLTAGIALLVGVGWVVPFAFRGLPGGVGRLVWAGWALAAVGLAGLGSAQWSAAGAGLGAFAGSPIGRALMWRAGFLAAALVALAAVRWLPPGRRRWGLLVAAIAATAAAWVHAATGHAATGSFQTAKVAGQWTHIVAVGVWLGGLAALLAGLRGTEGSERGRAVRTYSTAAAFGLVAILGTGVWRAVNEVGSFGRLFTTSYGWAVLAKIALFGVLAFLGARNRYRHVPDAERGISGLRRVGRVELGVAALALGVAALLATLVPGKSVVLAEQAESVVLRGSDFARTLTVELEITPGFAGPNDFVVRVRDADTEEPVDAGRVALRFRPGPGLDVQSSTLELDEEDGRWTSSGSSLAVAGPWTIVVLVERAGSGTEVELDLHTRCRTDVLRTPGQPTLHDVDLGSGRTAQGYIDPGDEGINQVHFTFFSPEGGELTLVRPIGITAFPQGGEPLDLDVRRFSAGHYIGEGRIEAGNWIFEIVATSEQGEELRACFEHAVE